MKEYFPNLGKEIDIRIEEAQRIPNKMDAKKPTPRDIIIKMPKVKDKQQPEGMGERDNGGKKGKGLAKEHI